MAYLAGGKSFANLDKAKAFAEARFQKDGVILGIEEKLSKKQQKALIAARIQNAVYGFRIPMMQIPALYRQMEGAIERGLSDEYLKAMVAAWPSVEESA